MKHKEHTGGAGSKDTFLLVPICWSWLKIIHAITGKIVFFFRLSWLYVE